MSMQREILWPIIWLLLPVHFLNAESPSNTDESPYLYVLGIAQDAGYPHVGCRKDCCRPVWSNESLRRMATSIALVDPSSQQRWLFECSPDFPAQLQRLDVQFAVERKAPGLDGIILTHAHIGHYTGLMHLGREALGARNVPVFGMPRMRKFLAENGPWSQLVGLRNIEMRDLEADQPLQLNERLEVTPWLVPHRDEFSETVGFLIKGPERTGIFIPDIDKWEKWGRDINEIIRSVDFALLDGTFFSNGELPGRDMSEIPHPFISETMSRMAVMPLKQRQKVQFIHLNHSNPAIRPDSAARRQLVKEGFSLAGELQKLPL